MARSAGKQKDKPPVRMPRPTSSPFTGRGRDRLERIKEALEDFRLVVDGVASRAEQGAESGLFVDTMAALARYSSILLRKLVIGEQNQKDTRLLDDEFCRTKELRFHKLRKVPAERKNLDLSMEVAGGDFVLTKLDPDTKLPQQAWHYPIAPQQSCITVQWPLSGTASWLEKPTLTSPWCIDPAELFDCASVDMINCDQWLGQTLALFDRSSVSLKDMIRITANTEGAHSVDAAVARKNREVHIVNAVAIAGVSYNHIILIQAALYLYEKLVWLADFNPRNQEVSVPRGNIVLAIDGDVFESYQEWLSFQGWTEMSFGNLQQSLSGTIRAPR